jgi:hypothetical protein
VAAGLRRGLEKLRPRADRETPGGPLREVFDNCFVMRFDADGRCREFTEWYMKRP